MRYDMTDLDATSANRLMTAVVTPRPIAWIVSQNDAGTRNAAPFSFFNTLCSWPPIVGIGIQPRQDGTPKDTRANIEENGEFVVNLVPFALADAMNLTSSPLAPDQDELEIAGIATEASVHVAPPRIAQSPVALECRLRQIIDVGEGRGIVLGDVLAVHVADAAVIDPETVSIDSGPLDLIARLHGAGIYLRTRDTFEIARATKESMA